MKSMKWMLGMGLLSFAVACGGGSGGEGSNTGQNTQFIESFHYDLDVTDNKQPSELPTMSTIDKDVVSIQCGANDITVNGALKISCLITNEDIYAACDNGDVVVIFSSSDAVMYDCSSVQVICDENERFIVDSTVNKDCDAYDVNMSLLQESVGASEEMNGSL